MSEGNMNLTLKVWRQKNANAEGKLVNVPENYDGKKVSILQPRLLVYAFYSPVFRRLLHYLFYKNS